MESASHAKKRQELSIVSRTRVAKEYESTVSRTRFAQKHESANAVERAGTRFAKKHESTHASDVKLLLAVNVITRPGLNTKKHYFNLVSKTNKR